MKSPFTLSHEERNEFITLIQDYYLREHNEELGNLQAGFLLDFFMREIAPTFYNLGVRDSHTYVSNKLDDLFEIEKR
ncbi:DUF2164 domain-containing protein [Gracilibacillus dipsosauri]|uniref:DUF2164 domain-containing protein n=1 Tax=Gracilibacillus dipsosauri TaxID=178340 RepID=A0A317KZ18_9BACI|nr:DUF2164 domain-containing protein [Gracilibacillus dipsosauri]PWU66889.1 DUF2164 domain-containing protein [Gracilibacillus dipsosauri]